MSRTPSPKPSKGLTKIPEELQMRLFEQLSTTDEEMTRVLDIYDLLPKFLLGWERAEKAPRVLVYPDVRIGSGSVKVTVTPAIVVARGPGQEPIEGAKPSIIFPGPREELIERAIRKLAVDRALDLGLEASGEGGAPYYVSLPFTLSQLRARLIDDGHAFKLSEIREGLEVMRKCHMSVEGNVSAHYVRETGAPLLSIPDQIWARSGDAKGERSIIVGTFHPLATQSILAQAHYPMSHRRIMRMRLPLARWIATRVIIKFRQARRGGALAAGAQAYNLTLDRIKQESGFAPRSRLRDTIADVRAALEELQREGFLPILSPPVEDLKHAKAVRGKAGRPRVIDASWHIYPSDDVCREIIEGNIERQKRLPVE